MATRHAICTKAEVGDDVAWRAEAMAPMLPPLQCPRPCTGAQVHVLCAAHPPKVVKAVGPHCSITARSQVRGGSKNVCAKPGRQRG